jgi:hypothetical protein
LILSKLRSAPWCAPAARSQALSRSPPTTGPIIHSLIWGGIVGFANTSDNLGAGSFNYAYLGGTTLTAPGIAASAGANSFINATGIPEDIETSIWSIDAGNAVTAQWINTDLSSPTTF